MKAKWLNCNTAIGLFANQVSANLTATSWVHYEGDNTAIVKVLLLCWGNRMGLLFLCLFGVSHRSLEALRQQFGG